MIKIVTIVGARPQFIKAAAVSRVLRQYATEILVHTGQHYDKNMSDIFFEELDIPKPDYNLGVGSGSHAVQTARMLEEIEKVCVTEKPDYVLIYGDTNSTLAGCLVASKLLIPVIHVEAGLRSFNRAMPEEQNRIVADHLSTYCFCPTEVAVDQLKSEGITTNVFNIGDVMCDAVRHYQVKNHLKDHTYFVDRLVPLYDSMELNKWYLGTIHRAENTDDINKLECIFDAFESAKHNFLVPVHPRIKRYVDILMAKNNYKNIYFVEPIGYMDMLYFTSHAIKVVTDSGGLQKEAYMQHVNVVTLREQTEWVETLKNGHNMLCPIDKKNIIDAIDRQVDTDSFDDELYGCGDAAKLMCAVLFNN